MSIRCELCFHHCQLEEGQIGFCKARANQRGKNVSLTYGRLSAAALDPIEKKPLRRFHPGAKILSVGSFGCNLRCPFCQNASISMHAAAKETPFISPRQLCEQALALCKRGNIGVAYTYNEPLISYEYVRDCARLVREAGLCNVLVTNGTIEAKPWQALLPYIDAVNIDLKGFRADWYHELQGDLDSVCRSIVIAAKMTHVEVTTLIVPGKNDREEEMHALAGWLASVDPSIVLHVSRFFPRHHMSDVAATPIETVKALAETARCHLPFVYTGNC